MVTSQELLRFCLEKGLLLDNEVLNLFSDLEDIESAKVIIEKIRDCVGQRIITKSTFEKNKERVGEVFLELSEENKKSIDKLKIKLGLSIEISREVSRPLKPEKILKEPIFNGNNFSNNPRGLTGSFEDVRIVASSPALSKKIEVNDFVNYFRSRLNEMKSILQEHCELTNLISINKLSGNKQNFSIIGIVSDKRVTKNKNLLLEVEDLTGKIKILINHEKKELYEKAEEIAIDSVLGFKVSGGREIVFANDIIFPESSISERKKSPVEEYSLFLGDIHVGSKLFLENNLIKFIDYLNGKFPNTPEVNNIKYLFIIGDLIAGVGVYPGQEKELIIQNVEEQYSKAAELLGKIRKDIKIIISPGNHDAVRIMEPQPILDEKYAWPLYNLKNILLVGNPCQVNIGSKPEKSFNGFDVLMYHGYSYHYYANNIPKLIIGKAVHNPDQIMHYLLKNRHLAPTHSSTLYFPSIDDPFIIKKVPDIFVSGHTHKSAVSYYNNILTISASAWESLTKFQEKMGNEPDFCKVPMFNHKTRAVKILDFE